MPSSPSRRSPKRALESHAGKGKFAVEDSVCPVYSHDLLLSSTESCDQEHVRTRQHLRASPVPLSPTSAPDSLQQHLSKAYDGLEVTRKDGSVLQGQELFQSLSESVSRAIRGLAPVAVILMDNTCAVIDMNPKAESIFGICKEEVVGSNIKAIMPAETASKHDDYVADYYRRYQETNGPPRSSIVDTNRPHEVLAKRYNGWREETFTAEVRVRGIPHPGGKHLAPLLFVGYVEDISARRELTDALQINRFIREKGDSALVVMTDMGKILDFNPAAAAMFRYDRAFIIGHNIKKLMPPEVAEVHDEMLRRYRERVASGMLHTSPVVGKVRELFGYRPVHGRHGSERFKIEMRVEAFNGGKTLVAFIKELGGGEGKEDSRQAFLLEQYPSTAVARLISGEDVYDRLDNVTVMFADIPRFEEWIDSMSDEEQFLFLNSMVKAFDRMGYGMEKVKSMGHSYVAYFKTADDAVYTALRMVEWSTQNEVQLQIGLDTGSVLTGIVGKTRKSFDIWGSTVEASKRMQQHCQPGQIQLSERCFDAIDNSALQHLFEETEDAVKGRCRFVAFVTNFENGDLGHSAINLLTEREMEERQEQARNNMRDQRHSDNV